eukprot:gene9751-1954_t
MEQGHLFLHNAPQDAHSFASAVSQLEIEDNEIVADDAWEDISLTLHNIHPLYSADHRVSCCSVVSTTESRDEPLKKRTFKSAFLEENTTEKFKTTFVTSKHQQQVNSKDGHSARQYNPKLAQEHLSSLLNTVETMEITFTIKGEHKTALLPVCFI